VAFGGAGKRKTGRKKMKLMRGQKGTARAGDGKRRVIQKEGKRQEVIPDQHRLELGRTPKLLNGDLQKKRRSDREGGMDKDEERREGKRKRVYVPPRRRNEMVPFREGMGRPTELRKRRKCLREMFKIPQASEAATIPVGRTRLRGRGKEREEKGKSGEPKKVQNDLN